MTLYKPSFGAERPKVVTIPREFTGIADRAFEGWTSLQKVILPKGIEYIGNNAFNGCSSLQSVDIPKSVKEIGNRAFEECRSLRSVVIPEGVKKILLFTFKGCINLRSVRISSSVVSIGREAFKGCKALESVIVPKGVEEIQEGAFQDCSALRSLALTEGLHYIRDRAFKNCSSLESLVVPESVRGIDGDAFACCSSLEAILFLGKGKASTTLWLSDDPFRFCGALRIVTFLRDACTHDSRVFRGCANLESILAFAEVARVKGRGHFFKARSEGKLGGVGQGALFGAVEKRDIVINASLESVRTALGKGETPELLYEILPFTDSSPDSPPPVFDSSIPGWRANGTTVWLVPFESESASELVSIFPLSDLPNPDVEIEKFEPETRDSSPQVDMDRTTSLVNYLRTVLDCETQVYLAARVVCQFEEARLRYNQVARSVTPQSQSVRQMVETPFLEMAMALQGRVDALKAGAEPVITLEHAAEVPPVPDKPEAFSMKAFADSLPPIEQPSYFKVGFFNKKKAEQANGILRAKYEQEVEGRAKEIALAKKKSEKAFEEYERACKLREATLDKLRNLEINKLNEKIERLIVDDNPLQRTREEAQELEKVYAEEERMARKELERALQIRSDLYSCNVIFSKYRTLPAIASILEYLESGRCEALSGPDGAYNLYESERRADLIITKLNDVLGSLEKIKEGQHLLYRELKKANATLEKVSEQIKSLETNALNAMWGIAKNTASIAERVEEIAIDSAATAKATQSTAEASRASVALAAKNNELLNSLGYLIALS